MIRQRSNSLQRKDREALEAAARSAKATPAQQTPVAAVEAPSTSASRSTSSKGPTVGRPRGFTVGAVPGPSSTLRSGSGGGTVQSAVKSRPRSLLSNQIFPLDLAEPRYKSRSGRDDDDSARKMYSMDIDRRVSSLTNSTGSPRAGPGVSINRGLSATSNSEREGNGGSSGNGGGSGERLAPENTDRRPSVGGRSRSGSSASLLQQVNAQPKSHASFVIAVVGHAHSGKSTVIKKGLRQFGLSKPHVLSERVTSHSTVCVVDQEQRTIEVLEIDASVLLNGPSKRFAWPKFLPNIDAVILCYDASEIASFRGMSELLENFAVANLSTVMLACKSEVHPKAVDPYYASDMACIYNVGLAECTVQSEEGKKRMRDCFSYLVKEVAKSRSGRARRGPASTVPPMPTTAMASQRSQSPGAHSLQALPQSRTGSSTSQGSNALTSSDAVPGSGEQLLMPAVPIDPMRARGYSNASSALSRGTAAGGSEASIDDAFMVSAMERATQAMGNMDLASNPAVTQAQVRTAATSGSDTLFTPRKMSSATVGSAISDAPSFQSEEDSVLHDSLQRAQMGLQNARSSGGYVSIEELWDKLFHAAISRTDERFVTMFMVFFRGFATPMDLLQQMMARFETLTAADVADGLVHRFALIRLTNMLGDWVLDYPGDLSHPETHALLVKYHRQLLHHPDTVHTAAQIHAAVEATANAVDLDALWSKAVNSDQTRHKGGIAAAIAGASSQQQQQQQQQQQKVGEADSASSLPASHSSSSTSGLMPLSGNTSHDFDGSGHSIEDASESHDQTGSESSLPMRPEIDNGGRSRSASDLTTSSTEGAAVFYKDGKAASQAGVSTVSSHTQTSSTVTHSTGTATNNASSSAASSSANLTDPLPTSIHTAPSTRSQDQKSVLRSISNTLMEVDDEIIATELTRLEWTYFTSIQPRDLLRHILVPHDKRDGPVSRSISHFNYISNWVCSMILAQGKTKHRARMLEKFMNIASILRHDNNYGSLNSVLGGLSKTAVHRLKHTRELLKGKSVNKAYQSLVRLMSNERSSAAYRLALENSDGPTIPYVGVHLQDILSISDGNPSKRGDGMIHWRKFSLMDEAVMAVARCQQYDRYIKPNPAVESSAEIPSTTSPAPKGAVRKPKLLSKPLCTVAIAAAAAITIVGVVFGIRIEIEFELLKRISLSTLSTEFGGDLAIIPTPDAARSITMMARLSISITTTTTLLVVIFASLLSFVHAASLPSSSDWTNTNYLKQIDLTGSTSHTITTISINTKSNSASSSSDPIPYYFLLSAHEADHLSWSRLTVKPALDSPLASGSDYKGGLRPVLPFTPVGPVDGDASSILFESNIPAEVLGAEGATLTLETTLNHITSPLPETVKQTQPQLFLWSGDSTIRSPYPTASGRIKVKSPSPKILSFSPEDATKSGSIVTFGPFNNHPAHTPATAVPEGKLHFQVDTPRATIISLDRVAEISHWGDALSIQDRILLRNTGPELKGHFSRIEHQMASFYQKGSGSALSSLTFTLPPGSKDPWFIDQIGNVSTSRFRPSPPDPSLLTASTSGLPSSSALTSKMSSLEIQPRFPLLGGWNYSFSIGYTLPLSAGGWTKSLRGSSDFITAIPLFTPLKHVAVDSVSTTIVLPEGATRLSIELPYDADKVDNGIIKTYLDTIGRPAIKVERKNCSPEHAQLVYLKYTLTHRANLIKVAAVAAVTAALLVLTAGLQRVETKIR
ncbi:hypothetical protein NDA16_003861 [Ustilago loliicola]|nr:hypothetical protein NDA16_003861 [Ustilago loliicola]